MGTFNTPSFSSHTKISAYKSLNVNLDKDGSVFFLISLPHKIEEIYKITNEERLKLIEVLNQA